MEFYHKDDGYPMSISIETMSVIHTDDDTCLYDSIVVDMDTDKIIAEFCHDSLLGRRKWAEGFFTALRLKKEKKGKNISAVEILRKYGIQPQSGSIIKAMEEYSEHQPKQITEEMEDKLVKLYLKNYVCIAEVCDEVLDRSGGLLGRIRDKATILSKKK